MKISKSIVIAPAVALAALLMTSCHCNTQCQRTITGATIGAVTGAVIDDDGGIGGAVIGGVVGGTIGAATSPQAERRNEYRPRRGYRKEEQFDSNPYYYDDLTPEH